MLHAVQEQVDCLRFGFEWNAPSAPGWPSATSPTRTSNTVSGGLSSNISAVTSLTKLSPYSVHIPPHPARAERLSFTSSLSWVQAGPRRRQPTRRSRRGRRRRTRAPGRGRARSGGHSRTVAQSTVTVPAASRWSVIGSPRGCTSIGVCACARYGDADAARGSFRIHIPDRYRQSVARRSMTSSRWATIPLTTSSGTGSSSLKRNVPLVPLVASTAPTVG